MTDDNHITKLHQLARIILLLAVFSGMVLTGAAQQNQKEKPLTRILFVFDGSQSMFGRWDNGLKIDIAKELLNELLDSLATVDKLQLALRAYGHQSQFISNTMRDCKDTKLEVPFGPRNVGQIKQRLNAITPKGTTPIAYSLEQAADDFPTCSNCRNVIILITDGIEECDGDPCAVSRKLQQKGIILKPFIIGVGMDEDILKEFDCVGNYFDASSSQTFKNVLNVVISQALNETTAQVNLLDINGKPTETDVTMTFHDYFSGRIRYNFVHTMNHRGNPDTLTIDPLATYRIKVHTIPAVEKDSVTLTPGKHTTIAIDAPQGDLEIKVDGRNEYQDLKCIVRQADTMETLKVQDIGKKVRYLVGKYDLEILTLPRMYVDQVKVSQNHTTTVSIPEPGIANILKKANGYGSVYVMHGNQMELIHSLGVDSHQENLVLQPGKYKIVFRPKNSRKSVYTTEYDFEISSGSSEVVKLY